MHIPKPFKNPAYTKNATRRTQTLKTLLSREKERDKSVRTVRSRSKNEGEGGGEAKMEIEAAADNAIGAVDGEDKMDVDSAVQTRPVLQLELDEDELAEGIDPDDIPSCKHVLWHPFSKKLDGIPIDFSIEAPPSFLPPKRYCDITGLEVSGARE